MPETWIRQKLTAALLSDVHFGSGSGGGGIDALVARDRRHRPVIWASHVEGVLRDAARRLRGEEEAAKIFGRSGGERQRAIFTSLCAEDNRPSRIWRGAARKICDRAPRDETLRVVEHVPARTRFVGEVELPEGQLTMLKRLVQEVDALGSGRSTRAGSLKLTLSDIAAAPRDTGNAGVPTDCLRLLLKNRDPVCVTATASPDNVIPSLAFVPGRTLLGALAAWLIAEGERDAATLLTSGKVSVGDAMPLPSSYAPARLEGLEVLPAPLALHSAKPKGVAGEVPWWALPGSPPERLSAWETDEKLKRPEDDLFLFRDGPDASWLAFRPARRVRLRNGRPDPGQVDTSLFAIEQIVEETHFLADLHGSPDDLKSLAEKLLPVLGGRRWLRVGRAGAPVEVMNFTWLNAAPPSHVPDRALLILTSDLLVRDENLRWITELDEEVLRNAVGDRDLVIVRTDGRSLRAMQDSVIVYGFNGTSRLWRTPMAGIRRGSVFEVAGAGVSRLAQRAARHEWLGERTHEGFGRYRIDAALPGVTDGKPSGISGPSPLDDHQDVMVLETIARETQAWFSNHNALATPGGSDRTPALSQWFDLVRDFEREGAGAIARRLGSSKACDKVWKQKDASAILKKLENVARSADRPALYAYFFVRWLRAGIRAQSKERS